MGSLLRVLMIENVDADAQLILRELRTGGYDVDYRCVETRAAMNEALSRQVWDIILYSHNPPYLSVMDALATLKESGHILPFFLRSDTIGVETGVMIFQALGQDFIIKESPAQLLSALAQELRDVQTQRSQR